MECILLIQISRLPIVIKIVTSGKRLRKLCQLMPLWTKKGSFLAFFLIRTDFIFVLLTGIFEKPFALGLFSWTVLGWLGGLGLVGIILILILKNSTENYYEPNCTNFWKILFPGVFNAKGKEICFRYSSWFKLKKLY